MAICDTESIRDCIATAALPDIDPHPVVILVLAPFIVIFVWAAWMEIRRWWLYGPSENKRSAFPINEDAPSYEPPPEEEQDDPEPSEENTGQEHRHD